MEMKPSTITIMILVIVLVCGIFIDLMEPNYGFFGKVDAGNVGIVTHFGKIKEETLTSGFHVTHFFEKINQVNVRQQTQQVELMAFSSDIQQTTMLVTVNYSITPETASTLFRTVGMNYVETLILPRIQENTKVVVSNFTAESLIANRETLSGEILQLMRNDLSEYGITIAQISIENIDFTDAFESAVEAKQVATQTKLASKTEQERITMEAEAAADRKRVEAQAQADVQKINADAEAYAIAAKAEAEAEANKKLAESITQGLIDYTQAQNWDGKLPSMYSSGGDSAVMVPIIGGDEKDEN